MLKSEIVPPVCPKCPEPPKQSSKGNGGGNCCKKKECPPCPRPQRCPEPAFTCKKVPNYNVINQSYLPEQVSGHSTYGM